MIRRQNKANCQYVSTLDHYIGVATSSDETAELDVLKIEASTWAVFESIGPFPETLQNVWGRIYSEWFPSSGYDEPYWVTRTG